MHHHGYLWIGPKNRFDQEALRRPPHPQPPPAGSRPELVQRYREVAAEFPGSDLPPLETAYWLLKPRSSVRGTWQDPEEAAAWIRERLAEVRLTAHLAHAVERLGRGGDVSLGFYLERPVFLSLAVVACSPRRERHAGLACPLGR
ncbi:hypothetical protein [Streptomyces antibioticus]|uniref:hypothetical protein n=1 Tax=Streptomyces antibioticus TaxID=1890 RepID=UPI0036DE577B